MKKLFSFSLFVAIVILALIARSTATAKGLGINDSSSFHCVKTL